VTRGFGSGGPQLFRVDSRERARSAESRDLGRGLASPVPAGLNALHIPTVLARHGSVRLDHRLVGSTTTPAVPGPHGVFHTHPLSRRRPATGAYRLAGVNRRRGSETRSVSLPSDWALSLRVSALNPVIRGRTPVASQPIKKGPSRKRSWMVRDAFARPGGSIVGREAEGRLLLGRRRRRGLIFAGVRHLLCLNYLCLRLGGGLHPQLAGRRLRRLPIRVQIGDCPPRAVVEQNVSGGNDENLRLRVDGLGEAAAQQRG